MGCNTLVGSFKSSRAMPNQPTVRSYPAKNTLNIRPIATSPNTNPRKRSSQDWRRLFREASSRQSALPITRQVHTACRKACRCEAQHCCYPSKALPWAKKPAFIFWSIVFSVLLVGASPMIAFLFTVATLAPFILLMIGFTLALVLLLKMNDLSFWWNIESSKPSTEPHQDKNNG